MPRLPPFWFGGLLLLAHLAGAGPAPSVEELARRARCAAKYPPEAIEALGAVLRRGGAAGGAGTGRAPPRVFFAALLHNNAPVLEGWTEALDRTIDVLGPSRAFVSVLESGSTDGTDARLRAWSARLTERGVPNAIQTGAEPASVLRPFKPGDTGTMRIEFLAKLRNEVLAPMLRPVARRAEEGAAAGAARRLAQSGADEPAARRALAAAARDTAAAGGGSSSSGGGIGGSGRFDSLVFLNDVVFCTGDVLRLLAHGSLSNASLACGLDFHASTARGESDFYDKWVMTDLSGRHALPAAVGGGAPEQPAHRRPGSWIPLHADRATCGSKPPAPCASKFEQPAQVFCCWNGIAVFDAAPFYEGARFRWAAGLDPASAHAGECAASECSLMCKDLWRIGHGRVLLDPAVQVAYSARVHAQRLRHLAAGAGGAVPPAVHLGAAQPEALDCYGLPEPGTRAIRWRAAPVRESLAGNVGPLPYGQDWEAWPAVVMAATERRARGAERQERARSAWRGAAAGAAGAGVLVLLGRVGCWRRARAGPAEYARLASRGAVAAGGRL